MSTIISPIEKKVNTSGKIQEPVKIAFFGTPDFAKIILDELISKFNVVAVITVPDKPKNRGQKVDVSPVAQLAEKNDIKTLKPKKIQEIIGPLKGLNVDIFITAAYGQILPQEILEIPRFGSLNVHGSLLPRYRGASPIQAAILNGDKKTGVSVMLMTEGMDEGPVILQKETEVTPTENFKTLHDKLATLGAGAIVEAIALWTAQEFFDSLNLRILKPQDNSQATYTKKITKRDGQINWDQTAQQIERQIRAFDPWPGTFFDIPPRHSEPKAKNLVLKLLEAEIIKEKKNPGQLFLTKDKKLAIGCKKDSLLIKKIQPEGKKVLTGQEFINGYQNLLEIDFR